MLRVAEREIECVQLKMAASYCSRSSCSLHYRIAIHTIVGVLKCMSEYTECIRQNVVAWHLGITLWVTLWLPVCIHDLPLMTVLVFLSWASSILQQMTVSR